jgi:hypothetical protein
MAFLCGRAGRLTADNGGLRPHRAGAVWAQKLEWGFPSGEPRELNKTSISRFVTVRARPGRLSALSVFLWKSILCGAFVWARRALKDRKWRCSGPGQYFGCELTGFCAYLGGAIAQEVVKKTPLGLS